MTQPSKRFDLWRRLYTRFTIEPLPAQVSESPGIGTIIQPTTDADLLLAVITPVQSGGLNLTAAAGSFVSGVTVPDGKRWRMMYLWRSTSIGSTQIDFIIGGQTMQFTVPGTAEELQLTLLGLHLDQGDEIGLITTNDAGDTAVQFRGAALEEDAF